MCRVQGEPAADPCVNASPASAYWGLWWADGSKASWTYSSYGIGGLTVPAGGSVGLSWQQDRENSGAVPPGVAPPVAAGLSVAHALAHVVADLVAHLVVPDVVAQLVPDGLVADGHAVQRRRVAVVQPVPGCRWRQQRLERHLVAGGEPLRLAVDAFRVAPCL